jgi:hypothetical protein
MGNTGRPCGDFVTKASVDMWPGCEGVKREPGMKREPIGWLFRDRNA